MPDTLVARSALGTASAAALRSHGDVSTVRLREIALPCMLDLRLDPDDLAATNRLGRGLQEVGRAAEALEMFERSLELRPGEAAIIKRVGDLRAVVSASSGPLAMSPRLTISLMPCARMSASTDSSAR